MSEINDNFSYLKEEDKPYIERRLKDYIKRKNFYKKNNIDLHFFL